MSYEKGKFRYSFFILLSDMNVLPQNWQIFIFYNLSLSLNVTLFQRVLIWLQLKQVLLEGFLRKHRDASMTIATSKMELFVALLSSFQLLTNFTKNPNIGAMGVLNGSSRILQGILKFVLVIKLSIAEL